MEIEKELKGARKEVKKIRADLVGKERQWQEERQKWQTEKEELIRVNLFKKSLCYVCMVFHVDR